MRWALARAQPCQRLPVHELYEVNRDRADRHDEERWHDEEHQRHHHLHGHATGDLFSSLPPLRPQADTLSAKDAAQACA